MADKETRRLRYRVKKDRMSRHRVVKVPFRRKGYVRGRADPRGEHANRDGKTSNESSEEMESWFSVVEDL